MNAQLNLQEAILDTELRHINFFNGRLLSGEDLSAERDANHVHLRQLGQVIGAGVACGLEVSRAPSRPPSDTQVVVTAGLAVNQEGQVLRLASDQTVSLVRTPDPAKKSECVFSDCAPFAAGSTFSGDGYYLLTIAPASQREGLAPISGLSNSPAACNSRYFTEGVQFRLLPMSVAAPSSAARARNEVAYQCFGLTTRGLSDLAAGATSGRTSDAYALNDLVSGKRLTASDVPLAVLEWKSGIGVGFIDIWSVRRRTTRPALVADWSMCVDDPIRSESKARFLQFQDQLDEMRVAGLPAQRLVASQYFSHLPPAGVLPMTGLTAQAASIVPGFFAGFTVRGPHYMEAGRLNRLLQESFAYPSIRVGSKEFISLYVVRDEPRVAGTTEPLPVRPAFVFASGCLPFFGLAQFDWSRWGGSNFV